MSASGPGSTRHSMLEQVRRGDGEAWRQLVTLYAPLVLGWCRRTLPADEVADVFQEVFHAAARHIAQFRKRQPGDTFRGWLRTIAANKVRDRHRRRRREPRGQGGSEMRRWLAEQPAKAARAESGSGPAAGNRRRELSALLARALARIRDQFAERTWQAFWRTAVEGRSPADVGSELGMSAGAVRVAKSRVLQRLRREVGDAD